MNKTICFTGPRPQNLPFKISRYDKHYLELKSKIAKIIKDEIKNGYTIFISGMALGIDLICANIVLNIKKEFPQIKLHCYLPCQNQENLWTKKDKLIYQNTLAHADKIVFAVNRPYCTGCIQLRNKMMIDSSDKVIAVFYGKDGGTKNTINYAESKEKEIILLA